MKEKNLKDFLNNSFLEEKQIVTENFYIKGWNDMCNRILEFVNSKGAINDRKKQK